MISVVIADDHDIYRHGLSMLLHDDERFTLVGEAKDGDEALALIHLHKPDVVVLDLSKAGMSGIEITAQLNAEKVTTSSIILTMTDDANSARRSMDAGAKGVVHKESAYADIANAIEFVSSGRIYSGMFQKPGDTCAHHGLDLLSRRELDILKCVSQGMTSKQVGDKLCISPRTVDTHRMRIMQKLDIHNGSGLTKFALESGLVSASFD